AGEIFGLLGPNGAGKTTTVEMIEGLREPDAGEVRVLGLDVRGRRDEVKQRIGVQLQTPSLFPRLTVLELLRLFATFYRRSQPPERLIAGFELQESSTKLVRQLSGGQQQRLSVALALINDPEVVFLDEPTSGLDPQARLNLWEVIGGLRERGKAVLLTTHYMEEAERLCDRVAIIDQGHIVALGSPRELIQAAFAESAITFRASGVDEGALAALPGITSVHAEGSRSTGATPRGHAQGSAGGAAQRAQGDVTDWTLYSGDVPASMAALLAYAQARGVALEGLTVRGATLEDVFLKLTGRRLRD
ncbi:MAG TPA: ABC transporter ATP-binding protein, partial [Dehalococcoidia bacterium]|nr:ABC transporter ATP-binding protein [Dehalococcoidia bacterium]